MAVSDCYAITDSEEVVQCSYVDGVATKESLQSISFRIVQFKKHDHEWSIS